MKNISIIVVSLNTKKDFIKTIKSIKDQNYEDAEIIVLMVKAQMAQLKK